MQNHYNLVYREEEREMLPLCAAEGIGVIPWSPLARGMLAGNRRADTVRARSDQFSKDMYKTPDDDKVVDKVIELAGARGVPPAQVALAWLLHKPVVTAPIVGASNPLTGWRDGAGGARRGVCDSDGAGAGAARARGGGARAYDAASGMSAEERLALADTAPTMPPPRARVEPAPRHKVPTVVQKP